MVFHFFSSSEYHRRRAGFFWGVWLILIISLWGSLPVLARSAKDQETKVSHEPLKVVSLDMCADQYALGLMSQSQILGLSHRARLDESYFKERVANSPRVKPKLETLLALKPDAVLRTYGGDPRMLMSLKSRGIAIIDINEVSSLPEARSELLRIGKLLGQDSTTMIELRRMDKALKTLKPAGKGKKVLYLTSAGYTSGTGTMVADLLLRLDLKLVSQNKGFYPLPLEVLLGLKPDIFAFGFYDDPRSDRRAIGRHPVVQKKAQHSRKLILPSRFLACSGWFNAYDLEDLNEQVVS
jgi:iron complex transport system substrate-binding protein